MYCVISSSKNSVSIHFMNKEVLERSLEENYWGEGIEIFDAPPRGRMNLTCWPKGILILNADDIVVPKPVEVVQKWELP